MKIPNAGENGEKTGLSYIAGKVVQSLLSVWQFVTKLSLQLPVCPAVVLLNMYFTEMKSQVQGERKESCIQGFFCLYDPY